MRPQRWLSCLDGDDSGTLPSKLRAFQIALALVIVTEYWTKALRLPDALVATEIVALFVATLLGALVLGGRGARVAWAGLALLQTWYVWNYFPQTGNHRYLELVMAILFSTLDHEDPDEGRLLLRALRWMVVVVLFCSGLQKAVSGYYFQGQFLAWSLWRESFGTALAAFVPAGEAARIAAYSGEPGDGPYLVSGPLLPLVSNLVWISEISLAALLVPRITRQVAWVLALMFLVAVEVVAREFMFGVEFGCALVLFSRADLVSRALIPVTIFLAALVLVRIGLLPEVLFH